MTTHTASVASAASARGAEKELSMNTYKHLARSIIFITVCLFVTPMTVHSQSEPSKCQGKKLKAAAKLALCKANLRAFDPQPEPPKLLKCQTRFVRAFAKADDKYGDDCPALGDQAAVESIVDANLARLQTAVGFRASSAP
jgi:hypothetical protein